MVLQTVRKGDPILADQWNELVGAANANTLAVSQGIGNALQRPWITNLSDLDVEVFQVLELTTPMFMDAADQLADFRELTSWKGVKPTETGLGNFAVMATPAEASNKGQIYVGPIVPVRVNITHDWLDLCDLEQNSHILKTKLNGTARILWKESATGADVRCIVRTGQVSDRFYWGVTQSTIAANGSGTVRVTEPGGTEFIDVPDVNLDHCHDDTAVQNNTDVRIWFSQLDLEWHIDGAACEPN